MPSRISSPKSTGWTFISSMRVRSTRMRLPLIVTHGWPGSVDRAAQDHRATDRPHRAWRKASDAFHVVIPSMAAMDFRASRRPGLGPDSHGPRLGRADEAPRLHAIRGAGRRLGRASSRSRWACSAPPELLGIHINFASAVPAEILTGALQSGSRAVRSLGRRKARVRAARLFFYKGFTTPCRWRRIRRRCTGLRIHRSASPPGCSTTTCRSYELIARACRWAARRSHERRHPRQHHALSG